MLYFRLVLFRLNFRNGRIASFDLRKLRWYTYEHLLLRTRKKIKSLLLNVLGNEDNYLNVNFLIEYFVKLT